MNKLFYALLMMVGMMSFVSCSDSETYADMKEDETRAIKNYIKLAGINVVSQSVFENRFSALNNGENVILTDTAKNEFVLFNSTGVYMQIVEQGNGANFDYLKSGETASVSCRYSEWNLENINPIENPDSVSSSNKLGTTYISTPDIMTVTNTTGTFTASFTSGVMNSCYGASVPAGWLVPMTYIKLGRENALGEHVAHVRIIVPSAQGHSTASSYVYPYYYDITYTKNK